MVKPTKSKKDIKDEKYQIQAPNQVQYNMNQQGYAGYNDLLQQLQQQGLLAHQQAQAQIQQLQTAAAMAATNNNPQLTQQLNQLAQQQLNQFSQHQYGQQMGQQMGGQMGQQMGSQMGGQIGSQMGQPMNQQINQQMNQQMNQIQRGQQPQQQGQFLQQQQLLQQQQQLQQLQQQQQQQIPGMNSGISRNPMNFEETANNLHSRYVENEIIKTFENKSDLVKFVKTTLNDEEQCRIVINSSKPKAIYFQCEKSGSFRTTVKDASKRQRVAYTKRNKCGYRLVANLYPPDKDKKGVKRGDANNLEDKLNEFNSNTNNEMWILRMINPKHNHPADPPALGKKKRARNSRILVEKPLPKTQVSNLDMGSTFSLPQQDLQNQMGNPQLHPQLQIHNLPMQQQSQSHQHQDIQDSDVLAAITNNPAAAAAAAVVLNHPPVDPAIDNVSQSNQDSHNMR